MTSSENYSKILNAINLAIHLAARRAVLFELFVVMTKSLRAANAVTYELLCFRSLGVCVVLHGFPPISSRQKLTLLLCRGGTCNFVTLSFLDVSHCWSAAAMTVITSKTGSEFLSECGDSHATVGVKSLESTSAASSLPSATAAVAMEEEDEEETKRALGQVREDRKVRIMRQQQQQYDITPRWQQDSKQRDLSPDRSIDVLGSVRGVSESGLDHCLYCSYYCEKATRAVREHRCKRRNQQQSMCQHERSPPMSGVGFGLGGVCGSSVGTLS